MLRCFRLLVAVIAFAIAIGITPRMMAAQGPPQELEAPGRGQPRAPGTEAVTNDLYIVRMSEDPVLGYAGGITGLAPTKPARRRQKLDPDDANVAAYALYLDNRHDAVLRNVGGRKIYGYRYAFNGFAAGLTSRAADVLRSTPGVVSVTKDELRTGDTSSTPTFLGLDQAGGLWDQLAGPEHAGENILIGIVDSGVWPESLSFTDREDWRGTPSATGGVVYSPMPRSRERCQSGEQFTSSLCNNKLIIARRFNAAWGGDAGIEEQRPWEFASPRDYNGHGTHTASTAGGNHGVPTSGDATVFGPVSGMAPRARLAVYKALWSLQDGSQAQGFTSDLVAAIDKAVEDGVDVINYSVSGTSTTFADPAEIAFFNAAASGVFVAASAGNSGPAFGTVAHPSPWITTVGAGTHNRTGRGSVTLGNGVTYVGASLATRVGPAPAILSTNAGLAGANPTAVRLCFAASDNLVNGLPTPVLDPAKVSGRIVVCDRGTNARVNKSLAVQQAGGIGMILVNTSPSSVNADFHFVPSIHLDEIQGAAIKSYVTAAGAGATATINNATIVYDVPAPFTAAFSSRGPLLAGGGDLLKPDLLAPGQDILASVAPPANAGRNFNLYSGTSMAAPHVAGLAALLIQRSNEDGRRDQDQRGGSEDDDYGWSPMMIKSALMTTATDTLEGVNTSPAVIFSQGAGHVSPNEAARPGLVFDSDEDDWLAFVCGAEPTSVSPGVCAELGDRGFSFDASDLNVPSIAIGDLAGTQSITRRVTNVGDSRATYSASVTGMAGIDVHVSPASFTIRPGRSQKLTVTFTRTTAPTNVYTGGQLTLTDGDHIVRIPMVIRPRALAAPTEVFSAGAPISYTVQFGYTGAFSAAPRGLVPALVTNGSVADDPQDSFDPNEGEGITSFAVNVPAGTTYARFSLFNTHVTPASDLDLYVFRSNGTFVGASGGGTSDEEVNLTNPVADTYIVFVHGFGVPAPPGTANFTLFTWTLGSTDEGNMTVDAPTAATMGATGAITLSFSGLVPNTKYLGSVEYAGTTNLPRTIVRVDP